MLWGVSQRLQAVSRDERGSVMRLRKVGGIWFVRLGRARLSFCIARQAPAFRFWPEVAYYGALACITAAAFLVK